MTKPRNTFNIKDMTYLKYIISEQKHYNPGMWR